MDALVRGIEATPIIATILRHHTLTDATSIGKLSSFAPSAISRSNEILSERGSCLWVQGALSLTQVSS